jgi:hypothetical protein
MLVVSGPLFVAKKETTDSFLIGHRPARLALLAWRAGKQRFTLIKKVFKLTELKICDNLRNLR